MATKNKVMVSFPFTGVSPDTRTIELARITNELQKSGVQWFCSNEWERIFDAWKNDPAKKWTTDDVYEFCLEKQKSCTEIIFVFFSERESSGMLLELELAKELGQPARFELASGCGMQEWMEPFAKYAEENPWTILLEPA